MFLNFGNFISRPPLGPLGRVFAGYFVKNDVKKIFNYRNQTITNTFSKKLLQGV